MAAMVRTARMCSKVVAVGRGRIPMASLVLRRAVTAVMVVTVRPVVTAVMVEMVGQECPRPAQPTVVMVVAVAMPAIPAVMAAMAGPVV